MAKSPPNQDNNFEQVEGYQEFVRDVTKVHPLPKSEVRQRLNALIKSSLEEAVRNSEDKTLKFASAMVDLFKDRPYQVEYVIRQLDPDRYRKSYKDVKISLRATLAKDQEKQ